MFSSGTTGYAASVANAVGWITIDPTTGDDYAQAQYLDANDMALADADTVRTGFQANLAVGANIFKVRVTAEDGMATVTYAVTVTRALDPPGQVIGLAVESALEALDVSWTGVISANGYKVQWKSGNAAFEGGGSRERVISGGSITTYRIPDLTPGVEYTVRVIATRFGTSDGPPSDEVKGTPRGLSMDATLSDLEVFDPDGTEIALTPMFSSGTTAYAASVANAVGWITMDYTTSDANAQVQYLDASDLALDDADTARTGFQANLAVGANIFKVRVTAEDGMATVTYAVTVTRALDPPGQVIGLAVESALEALDVSWTGVISANGYKVQWKSGNAAFEGGGSRERVISGGSITTYRIPDLTPGVEYTVRVIATRFGTSDGPPSDEVKGTPRGLSMDATLSDLEVFDPDGTEIALTPMFSSGTTAYAASVANAVGWITMDYTTSDANAQVQYLDASDLALDDADTARTGFQANLAVGANIFKVRVTAEDGMATVTYAVTVTRALDPPGQVIGVEVEPAIESLAVSWNAVEIADGYKVQWKLGNEVFEGGGARERVVAGAGTTTDTIPDLTAGIEYTVRVIATRTGTNDGPPSAEVKGTPRGLSMDATLSDLEVFDPDGTEVALTPMFSSGSTAYTASVANAVGWITMDYTTSDANAQVQYLDASDLALDDADTARTGFQANLAVGANIFKARVTAEDGMATVTYAVTVTRAMAAPGQVLGVDVDPAIEALVVSWNPVEIADKYMVQWKWGDHAFEGSGDREQVVNGGGTTSTIPNLIPGMEYTLRVIAFRSNVGMGPPSNVVMGIPLGRSYDATLSDLRVTETDGTAIALTPAMFSATVTGYSAFVAHSVARVKILPTTSDANAQVQYLDANDMELADADSGTTDFEADLNVGENTVKVRIAAEDDLSTETYTLTLRRAIAPPDRPTITRVFPGPEALIVLWEAVADADGYKLQWKSGDQDYESGGDREAVIEDGTDEIHTILYLEAGTEYTLRLIATKTGAADSLPSKEAKGTPYAREVRSDTPNTDTDTDTDGGGGDNTNTGGALTDLEVTDPDDVEVTLSPSFSTSRRSYTASVANTVTWVTFKPTLRDATVAYEDGSNQTLTDADGNEDDFQVNLAEGANTVKLRVTPTGETTPETYIVAIARAAAEVVQNNNAPTFSSGTATREFAEDVGDGTRTGVDVGAPVTADDTDNDTLSYTLEGTDEALFAIVSTTGQIRSRTGINYDRESDSSYSVTVKADDGRGGSDTIAVTINLTNAEEKPLTPNAPTVSAVSGSTTSVSVTWTPPTNTGRPSIASYDLQYKKSTESNQDWQNGPQTQTGTSATISSLDEDTNYDVQVRATNADGDGPWSGTGTGKTARPGNRAPDFGASSATREFEENFAEETSGGVDVGAPVTATDDDNDSIAYSLEGTDAASFDINSTSGQISTLSGTNYDRESDPNYSVTVKADDGEGGTDTISVTINVTDVEEKPLAPDAPTVSSVQGSTNSLSVEWTAPTNTGRPSIASYDLQYKKTTDSDQDWQDGPQNRTGTTATISSLDGNTSYDVQVRATNADGDGPWSGTGSGTTNADPPQIGSAAIRSFDEDVGDGTRSGVDVGSPVRASDHGASHTYTLGGTDSGSFTVGSSTGQIRSRSGANYDFEAQSSYSVSVESDDGNGGTESIPVTINLNDVTEKPKEPAAPTVQNIAGNSRVIYVTWTAPSNTGRPPITSYDLQYREGNSGPWFNGPQDQTGMNASISSLSPSTEYDVQVRATNDDGDSLWSDEGSASTSAALAATCASSENGNVRLADGFTPKEGRVEICALDPKGTTDTSDDEQVWGTICDDYFTDDDADVVCKALGYHNSEPIGDRFRRSYFGTGEPLKILLDDLLCDGDEDSLLECAVAGNRPGTAADYIGIHNCKVSETVGVRCLTESEYTQHVTEIEMDDNSQSPMLSVADVTVYEAPGTTMDFVITLAGTPTGTVTVNYATHEGSAHANIDYVPKSGMVTFPLGTTSRTVGITMLDDLVDEHVSQGEQLTLRLSNAIGADILDGVAYGNIRNSDPLPQAWLARFGRAAADQAVEVIGGRLTASGPRASQVTVAGRRLNVSGNMSPAEAGAATLPARDGGIPVWNAHGASGVGAPQPGALGIHGITGSSVPGVIGPSRGYNSGGYRSSGVSGHQLLTGTSFQWALGEDGEADESLDGEATGSADRERRANWTAWGEGAATRFSGAEDTLSLQGDVATATPGRGSRGRALDGRRRGGLQRRRGRVRGDRRRHRRNEHRHRRRPARVDPDYCLSLRTLRHQRSAVAVGCARLRPGRTAADRRSGRHRLRHRHRITGGRAGRPRRGPRCKRLRACPALRRNAGSDDFGYGNRTRGSVSGGRPGPGPVGRLANVHAGQKPLH